jgi:hypothetical protein
VECHTGAIDLWGGAFRKNKDDETPTGEWPQLISTLQGCSGFFMYVSTVAKQMMTDRFLAQHDFSQDPVVVKSKDHLVRPSRILVFL